MRHDAFSSLGYFHFGRRYYMRHDSSMQNALLYIADIIDIMLDFFD